MSVRRRLGQGAVCAFWALVAVACACACATSAAASSSLLKGIYGHDGSIYPTTLPGVRYTDYNYMVEDVLDYFTGKGMNTLRQPVVQGRLMPTLGGDLDSTTVGYLISQLYTAIPNGVTVILAPVASSGVQMYDDTTSAYVNVGTGAATTAAFADFWSKMATTFSVYPSVVFALWDDPSTTHSPSEWYTIATAAITAIRATGATNKILIPGSNSTIGEEWVSSGNAAVWAGYSDTNFAFDLHQFLNSANSVTTTGCVTGKGATALVSATAWARTNSVELYLGQTGWDISAACQVEGAALLSYTSSNSDVWFGYAAFMASTSYWASYSTSSSFNLQPSDLATDTAQMAVFWADLNATMPAAYSAATDYTAKRKYKGTSLAGAEFAPTSMPGVLGVNYIWPTTAEVSYFANANFSIIRLPFLGGRLAPTLNGTFDATYLSGLKAVVTAANALNVTVLLDPHDYGYMWNGSEMVLIGIDIATDYFASFWVRLAQEFLDNPLVFFGLMNEPNVHTAIQWRNVAEQTLTAIRAAGATNKVFVQGTAYTGAWSWITSGNAAAWTGFTDTNFAFELHQYLDSDSSGSSATCTKDGESVLADATAWALRYDYELFLGEIGWSTETACMTDGTSALAYMADNPAAWLGYTYWAAGPWWGSYVYTLEPTNIGTSSQAAQPQQAIIEADILATPTPVDTVTVSSSSSSSTGAASSADVSSTGADASSAASSSASDSSSGSVDSSSGEAASSAGDSSSSDYSTGASADASSTGVSDASTAGSDASSSSAAAASSSASADFSSAAEASSTGDDTPSSSADASSTGVDASSAAASSSAADASSGGVDSSSGEAASSAGDSSSSDSSTGAAADASSTAESSSTTDASSTGVSDASTAGGEDASSSASPSADSSSAAEASSTGDDASSSSADASSTAGDTSSSAGDISSSADVAASSSGDAASTADADSSSSSSSTGVVDSSTADVSSTSDASTGGEAGASTGEVASSSSGEASTGGDDSSSSSTASEAITAEVTAEPASSSTGVDSSTGSEETSSTAATAEPSSTGDASVTTESSSSGDAAVTAAPSSTGDAADSSSAGASSGDASSTAEESASSGAATAADSSTGVDVLSSSAAVASSTSVAAPSSTGSSVEPSSTAEVDSSSAAAADSSTASVASESSTGSSTSAASSTGASTVSSSGAAVSTSSGAAVSTSSGGAASSASSSGAASSASSTGSSASSDHPVQIVIRFNVPSLSSTWSSSFISQVSGVLGIASTRIDVRTIASSDSDSITYVTFLILTASESSTESTSTVLLSRRLRFSSVGLSETITAVDAAADFEEQFKDSSSSLMSLTSLSSADSTYIVTTSVVACADGTYATSCSSSGTSSTPVTQKLYFILPIVLGGVALLALVAFFCYRRRSSRTTSRYDITMTSLINAPSPDLPHTMQSRRSAYENPWTNNPANTKYDVEI